MSRSAAVALLVAALAAACTAQIISYVPDNAPPLTAGNTIPFGSSNPTYTYVGKIPASFMSATHRRVEEIAFMPAFSGIWTAGTVLMGFGHLPSTMTCPFTFPGPGGATPGMFLDFTVVYDSTVHGAVSWPLAIDTWCPIGLATAGGASFIWNGVNDVGFYITFQGASGGGAFRRSPPIPPTRTYASSYQAATSSGCDTTYALYMRLTLQPTAGLVANFTATPSAGPAALTVSFTDTSFTDDPAGIQWWMWDFENDGIVDSTVQNPTFTYFYPGSQTVALTVGDTMNPNNTMTRVNAVVVGPYVFDAATSGGGAGNLTLTGVPMAGAPNTAQGYTFLSFVPAPTLGGGPAFGLQPDANFFAIITVPAAVGNPVHYLPAAGVYPEVPFVVAPGTLSFLAGVTADFVQVGLDAALNLTLVSNVDRVTF